MESDSSLLYFSSILRNAYLDEEHVANVESNSFNCTKQLTTVNELINLYTYQSIEQDNIG